jgi:L-alanine-DL-glutamate epimerase-like enolase superfamily enzyme
MTTVTVTPSTRPLLATLASSVGGHGHATEQRAGIELKLSVNSYLVGRGESSPLPAYSPDRLEDVADVLRRRTPFDVELPEHAEACGPLLAELSSQLTEASPSSRFAFEGALVELFALHLKCSVAAVLRAIAESPPPPVSDLAVAALVTTRSLEDCLTAAHRAWSLGYRTLKLKLGPDTAAAPLLSALRSRYGQALQLRLDLNGSCPAAELPSRLETFRPFDPELVEEPVPFRQLLELDTSPVPLALDESLVEPAALSAILERREALRLRAIVLKPALHGLMRAIELSNLARRHNVEVVVTHLFDGPVGHATAASLALAVGSRQLAHGLAPHPGLLLDATLRIAGLGQGRLRDLSGPGLPLNKVHPC